MSDHIDVIPLGGLGEFGMNCTAIRCGEDMILVDAGIAFPNKDIGSDLGVRIIVPDITFLKEHVDQLRGIVLTHGHEDHIGAVAFIINEIDVPVYGSPLTLGLVRSRLQEHGLDERAELIEVAPRQKLTFGSIEVEAVLVTHSFPDSYSLCLRTPIGQIVWTGDFKFDQTPVDGKLSDVHQLASWGEEGVLALFSDSTNSAAPGLAPAESSVYEPLRALFRRARGKVVATTFASSINRIQVFLDLAREFDRQVALAGRSMVTNTRIASELGYLSGTDRLVSVKEACRLPASQVLLLASGSQGEPMSAMSRLGVDQYKKIEVTEGDIVILSARIIPGNEKSISRMVNHFYRRGARVFDPSHSQIHASGHGYRDDLKIMLNLVRPRFFVPIHGEYSQLVNHTRIARAQGIDEDRIKLIESGDVLRLMSDSAKIVDQVAVGRRFVDDGIVGEVHEMVLRDRRFLSEDGFVVVILRLDRLSGELIGEPEIVSRGFVLMDESEDLLAATRDRIVELTAISSLEEKQDEELFNESVRKELKRFLKKQTGKRPVILSQTIEI